MRAVVVNCTLKSAPEPSNTETPADVVAGEPRARGVGITTYRVVDENILPGVQTDMGQGDGWPRIHRSLLDAEIPIVATPTWVGHPSSPAQRVIERMDAILDSEQGRDWSHKTARAMASNLYAVAEALAAQPVPAPPE
ncbi:flavodoxin family protein [Nonomuraea jiangxiensis]|uniref:NADPH-dependent FMN reductase n=1 Tax=Nonomuraea jiangxiensis TaxID=633440 RepID=A0A1G8S9Q4_9ACTN|nr:NAD(P)H-dependent oxidoreductase [Nonomuraea jiangxiensis]SDJ25535.1 NADPH-dependent FMN reductase [Nonomuraea jiangxiensis]